VIARRREAMTQVCASARQRVDKTFSIGAANSRHFRHGY
jgi:hypothetical protein